MSRLLIRNGRVVDPSQDIDQGMDLLLEDGVVAELAQHIEADAGTEVLDANGLVVAPGFIDLHAHLREPGFEYKETIATGCRAAVAGGFTAVCSLADTDPVNDDPAVTRFIRERAAEVGLGGCMIASIKKSELAGALNIPSRFNIPLVIALGTPAERVEVEDLAQGGDIRYWRDGDGTHHVPKRTLDELIFG